MKRVFVLLTVLGLAFSPLMASQAQATPAKHAAKAKHQKKQVKKHATRHASRKHKIAV